MIIEAAKSLTERQVDPRLATVRELYKRAPKDFRLEDFFDEEIIKDLSENDILDAYEDFLRDERQIEVRDDGLITFEMLDEDQAKIIGNLDVVLFHYTSTKRLGKIRKDGLQKQNIDVNRRGYPNLGVYLTTEWSGPPVRGYISNAKRVFGGDGARITVRVKLSEIRPDSNDSDIPSGARQFVIQAVPTDDIVEIEKDVW